ncbi:MAG: sulfatase [Bacteroidota bacterium]
MISRIPAFVLFVLASCLIGGCASPETNEAASSPPNLIVIIADDLSWDDLGTYGHPHIKTPNLDRMAKEGMQFNQAFLTTSSCSPSRSSILTGQYPHNTDAEQLHFPLPGEQITFVEKLKESGYWTAQAGKWHLGDAVRDRFDVIRDVGTIGFALSADGKDLPPEGDGSGCENWLSLLRDRPVEQPFFLWLAAVDPHRIYEEGAIDEPHTADDVIVPPYMPDVSEVRADLALYYDEVSRLDSYVGLILDELEAQGIAENTLVLFMSDNGRPFQRDKTTLYDGGIKTPFLVKWPASVDAASQSNSLVSAVDIAPTFLSLAGVAVPENFEGLDFSPIFTNPEAEIRGAIYAEDHWHDHDDFGRAVRTHQYKYIRNFFPEHANTPPADALTGRAFKATYLLKEAGALNADQLRIFNAPRPSEELYDVVADPFELENLVGSSSHQEVLLNMRARLAAMREASGDTDPEFRTPDEFDRVTGAPNEFRSRPRLSKDELRAQGAIGG